MRALVACALLLPFASLAVLAQDGAHPDHALHVSAVRTTVSALMSRHMSSSESLRVTHVSLYKNGVGFFEHTATVHGDDTVGLDLTSAQLNDVLQSLTVVDLGGGRVSGANYNSTTPLDQQLRTLPLSLGQQPSEDDLFNSLRGAHVEVRGAGAPFTGRLLSMELRPAVPAPNDNPQPAPQAVTQRRFLTVVADTGATRTLELTSSTVVEVLDRQLRSDLNTYLELLDRNRTDGVRHMVLQDRGEGTRELHISFLSEVPVWKSTYRVLLRAGVDGAPSTATLQGFSVIDNTTGEDWNNVQLSLVAGSPQSFLQPISQPIYDRRPEVPIAENAQTVPQTHEAGEGNPPPPPPPGSASADLSSGTGGNPASLFGSPTGTGSGGGVAAAAKSKYPVNINMMKDTGPPPPPMAAALNFGASPELLDQLTQRTTQARTTTAAFDDFFAYNLTDPVTIPRNGSALVPILQEHLPVETVTLWSAAEPNCLRALWLTNSSALTLDRGSFSVVENSAFAGQGLLDPVHPGEKRLLSYAVDQAVRVTPEGDRETRHIASAAISQGVLRLADTEVVVSRYKVADAAAESRTVVLEVPRREGWTLDPEARPADTTAGLYRFRVQVPPHSNKEVTATQRHVLHQYFSLTDSTEEQLTLYLHDYGADPRVLTALQPVFAARRHLAAVETHLADVHSRIATLEADQKRLRENLQALKGSAEERALARRYTGELNTQEDSLAALTHELDDLQRQRTLAAEQLTRLIADVQLA